MNVSNLTDLFGAKIGGSLTGDMKAAWTWCEGHAYDCTYWQQYVCSEGFSCVYGFDCIYWFSCSNVAGFVCVNSFDCLTDYGCYVNYVDGCSGDDGC